MQKEYDLYAKFGRRDKDVPFFTTFALSPKREDLDAATEPSQNTPETQKADESNHFKIITNDFCDIIRKFNTTIKAVIAMSAVAKGVHLETEVLDFFTKNGDRIEDGADKVIFGLHQHHYEALSKKLNKLDALYSGLAAMPELFVLGLISAYDAFLTELIKAMFRTKPDLLASTERTLTFSELAKMGSIEAAQEFIIEKEVESVIRQSHADHFSWLEKKLGIPFKKDLKIWPKFIELCERRNLLTHTGGIISSQYLQVCTMHSVDVSGLSVGEKLPIDSSYVRKSLSIIDELGMKLIQVIWRKLHPAETEIASTTLNEVAYDYIVDGRYGMANVLLEFGLSLPNTGPDRTRRMMLINNANAYKLRKNDEKALEILKQEDWSAVSNEFLICVAAIKDEVKEVCSLIRSGSASKDKLRNWPVFQALRSNEEFAATFESHFREPLFVARTNKASAPDAGASEAELAEC